MRTYSATPSEVEQKWYLIDAEGAVLGRLAALVATRLRGKHKPMYTPHIDCGDHIVVINAEKVTLTGNKRDGKLHYWHTGYPGGIKFTTPEKLKAKKPEELLKLAVKRMMPGGPLSKKQLSKLKIYKGTSHPHESQNPKIIDFAKINSKNYISIN